MATPKWCETLVGPCHEIEFSKHSPPIGSVNFANHHTAVAYNLSYINDAGSIILKVDDTSLPDGQLHQSVRVGSTDTFGFGTLWVLDACHVPYGCGYITAATTGAPVAVTFRPVSRVYTGVKDQCFQVVSSPVIFLNAYLRSRWNW